MAATVAAHPLRSPLGQEKEEGARNHEHRDPRRRRPSRPIRIWDQGALTFVLGALMFYVLLYQSRLVPRWLSAWGLVGAALGIVPPLGGMFGLSLGILVAPLALQEMVMAVWLIAKGFDASALAGEATGEAAGEAPGWQAAASGSAA